MIETLRLKIRGLLFEDWAALKSISLDFGASEYAIYDMHLPTDDKEIQMLCGKFSSSGLWYAVCLGQRMIGYICFHENNGSYDIGFCFHSDHNGKGYAYESCSALIEHIAKERDITLFTAGTALENKPARRLIEKLGFVLKDTETVSFHKDQNGNDITFEGGIFYREYPVKKNEKKKPAVLE